jgi:hypothetical protein
MQDPVGGHNVLEHQGDVVDRQAAVLVFCDDESLVQEVGGPEAEPGGEEAGAEAAARQDVTAEDVGAAGAGAEEALPCRLVQFLKRKTGFLDKNAAE